MEDYALVLRREHIFRQSIFHTCFAYSILFNSIWTFRYGIDGTSVMFSFRIIHTITHIQPAHTHTLHTNTLLYAHPRSRYLALVMLYTICPMTQTPAVVGCQCFTGSIFMYSIVTSDRRAHESILHGQHNVVISFSLRVGEDAFFCFVQSLTLQIMIHGVTFSDRTL